MNLSEGSSPVGDPSFGALWFGEEWPEVVSGEFGAYLAPLSARGSGLVRGDVATDGLVWSEDSEGRWLWLMCRSGERGRYAVGLLEPEPVRTTSDVGDGEGGRGLSADESYALSAGTWDVIGEGASKVRVEATVRRALGVWSAVVGGGRLAVRVAPQDFAPGACRACGSMDFNFSALAGLRLAARGENEFVIDDQWAASEAELVEQVDFQATFVQLACANCNTAHPSVETFSGVEHLRIGHQQFPLRAGHGRVSLGEMFRGGADAGAQESPPSR